MQESAQAMAQKEMTRAITMTGDLAHKIATRRKTLHLHPSRYDADYRHRRCPYPQGQAIPVVKPDAPDDPVLHVEITEISRVTLAQLTSDHIHRLGHRSLYDHQHDWLARFDRRVDLADPAAVVARYIRKWECSAVWLLALTPTDAPRLLSAKPPSETAKEGDYTADPRRAMLDAGEAVPVSYQEQLSKDARKRDDEERRGGGGGKEMRSKRFIDRQRHAA